MNMENNQLKLNNKKEIRKSQPKNIKDQILMQLNRCLKIQIFKNNFCPQIWSNLRKLDIIVAMAMMTLMIIFLNLEINTENHKTFKFQIRLTSV